MSVDSPFVIEVFDKDLERAGWLGGYRTLTATPRHNAQPTAAVTVDADHGRVADLNTPGARARVWYRGDFLMSGPVRLVSTDQLGPGQVLTYQVADDWRLLRRILAWQVPGAAITAQGAAEYAIYTGPAETVVKTLLGANLTRLGAALPIPVTVAPDLGRGADVTVQVRMHHPADRLLPVIDQAGIGVSVRHVGDGLVVDCYEPQAWPITLSQEAGTILDGGWSRTPPEATRVVVGGPGEGTARVFRTYVNTALEAQWGDLIETFVDARDIKADDPNLEALMAARGAEALAAGASTAGLSLQLSETDTFRYGGQGIHVGDLVTAELAPGLTVTDVIREATLTDTPGEGLRVVPQLGERADDDQVVARAVAKLAKTVRDLRAGR